jgi:hypothetical protein
MITQTPNSTTSNFTFCTPVSTTTTVCIPCVHPFKYLFELIQESLNGVSNSSSFEEALDRLLDKGVVLTSCKLCCPGCGNIYSLASVETQLKLLEAIEISSCCLNGYGSVETYLKYLEAFGDTNVLYECCNGFTECIEKLECLVTSDATNAAAAIDILLDKGVTEFGNFVNNCTGGTTGSDLCYLVQLIKEYVPNPQSNTYSAIVNRILDKGITISCYDDYTVIGSVETWLKYGEAVGLTQA